MYKQRDRLYHPPDREVWTLLVLLTIPEHTIQGEDASRYEIVRLQKIEILPHVRRSSHIRSRIANIMVDT